MPTRRRAPTRPSLRGALASAVLALAACGAGPRPATDADFEAMQVEEARLARALHAAREADGACPDRQAASADACDAAAALCARARATDDADARARCARAEAACAEADDAAACAEAER